MLTTNGTKYTFVCDPEECDTLIEVTCVSGFDFPNGVIKHTCPCGREMSYISATILSSEQPTKEEPMIENALPEVTAKIAELEAQLRNHQNCDYWKAENGRIGRQLIDLVNDSYDNDSDSEDILNSICEIIDYNPVKTVQFEGVIHFSGSMDIPRNEVAEFDLTQALEDVYVDINNGNVVIDNYELYSVEEPY
jgi:hypothetical protein